MPDIAKLRELLAYDPETGIFTWKKPHGYGDARAKVGDRAGCKHESGYPLINALRKRYRAHRLAYEFIHGPIPDGMEIDHINGVRDDNRIINLRLATKQQNRANSRISKNNKSGKKGVHRSADDRYWVANIRIAKKTIHLGLFSTVEEAHLAYVSAAKLHFGEYARAE